MNIVRQYGLKFYRMKDDDGRIRHFVRGGGAIGDFLNTLVYLHIIDEGLSNVDYYINGGVSDSDKNYISSDAYSVRIDNSDADVYFDAGDECDVSLMTLPIEDFREILQAWKDFLQAQDRWSWLKWFKSFRNMGKKGNI